MVHWVKDLALSLLWLGLLLWHCVQSMAWELAHAMDTAKKRKEKWILRMFKSLSNFFVNQLKFYCNDREILSEEVLNFYCIFVKIDWKF